ncbi:fibronectin type III domain-containing protein [Leifsonia sp. F6_8S_P_1B]|uniref:Fibronectin type III domain-containing protein n=1 Tax=Leifsonia williamsii TaxID=3035919 RepID=A0ABT8K9G1_9MICO|nr:fibronectin type III domain-containing protein [Leifsonia williamsii]MDN4613797.1 fibronectin type III domain-containing protein [Leifsonia williamsii]
MTPRPLPGSALPGTGAPSHAARRPRLGRRLLAAVGAAALLTSAWPLAASAAPVVGGTGTPVPYTEQGSPVPIGQNVTITSDAGSPSTYGGGYIDFQIDGDTASSLLSLRSDAAPSTASGVISIVGGVAYRGNGTTADVIGSVDENIDGTNGHLRVNFTSPFSNSSFEDGITGWTPVEQRIDLGVTDLAGFPSLETGTYPSGGAAPYGAPTNQDNTAPQRPGTFSVTRDNSQATDGVSSLSLSSSGMTTTQGCDVVHGPAVYSDVFPASQGDQIYFDWRAFYGDDAYDVLGYVLNTDDGTTTPVLDATGTEAGNTEWATVNAAIPKNGNYRFVFVSGTFDFSCGRAAGASLRIDNVRVYGTKANDAAAQEIARRLLFSSTSDNPPTTPQTLTVTVKDTTGKTGTNIQPGVQIAPVDDAPTIDTPAAIAFTNTEAAPETFAAQTGTLSAADPDSTGFTYGVTGASASSAVAGYDLAKAGASGTLYVNSTTGAYRFEPDAAAIDRTLVSATDAFAVTVTADGKQAQAQLSVAITVAVAGTAHAPTGLQAAPGDASARLTWTAPDWTGGAAVTGYRIETSTDGGTTWVEAVADTGSADTSATVTGLQNGTDTRFRVSAITSEGTGAASDPASTTPRTAASPVTVVSVKPGNHTLTVDFAPPASTGGTPVTGYEYSLDGGKTWTAFDASVSPLVVRGLDNGTDYAFTMRAVTAAGPGAATDVRTVQATVSPVLLPGDGGQVLPELEPGQTRMYIDGELVTVKTSYQDGVLTIQGDGYTLRISADDENGVRTDANGRIVIQHGGAVHVSGSGFKPGSTADLWLFSAPVLLGEPTVDRDGAFAATYSIPASTPAGPHTLQINGLSADGALRTAVTGVVLEAAAAPSGSGAGSGAAPVATVGSGLASTGSDAASAVIAGGVAGALVLLGAVVLLVTRLRRRHSA